MSIFIEPLMTLMTLIKHPPTLPVSTPSPA